MGPEYDRTHDVVLEHTVLCHIQERVGFLRRYVFVLGWKSHARNTLLRRNVDTIQLRIDSL